MLARFDHPGLLKVHRFWEGNGTAYMVMPMLHGRTLRELCQAMAQAPDEAWLRRLLDRLLGALEVLHQADVFHRDIAPDNIHIAADGAPILRDFGAARQVISGRSQALTAMLKPNYAPIEQYGESQSVAQLRAALAGQTPVPLPARAAPGAMAGLAPAPLPPAAPVLDADATVRLAPAWPTPQLPPGPARGLRQARLHRPAPVPAA